MIQEEFVTVEQAILLEEKGFPTVDCCELIDETYRDGKENNMPEDCFASQHYYIRKRPTQSLVQKWLREEKKIWVTVENDYICPEDETPRFSCRIYGGLETIVDVGYSNYEEALSVGLNEALNLI